MDFAKIRKDYEHTGIDESRMQSDPIEELRLWVQLATENSPGKWFESNAMALATCDLEGRPTCRMVLLKGIVPEGIRFFTNYESLKGRQLAANPRAAVAFHWPYLGRQVRVEGSTEKTDRQVSQAYFHSRPRGAQIGASVSAQSTEVDSWTVLEDRAAKLDSELAHQQVPLPDHWGGYLLKPTRFEFWQGKPDRLHNRICYQLQDDGSWRRFRLSP